MSLFTLFNSHKKGEFELDTIGLLSEYSFTQLEEKILLLNKRFTVKKESIGAETFLAVFESPRTKLSLIYSSDGKFISKKSEIIKDY